MNKILIETSAWIEYFKGNEKYLFLDILLDQNRVCTNDIILSELLPSITHKKELGLAGLLTSIYTFPLTIDWNEIRAFQLTNFKNGNNNIGISDIIIAQNSIQNNLEIVTEDKHFRLMASYLPLTFFDENSLNSITQNESNTPRHPCHGAS
ncbi:MAG: PIN domain-containing protein [Spirochaetaceae bacterium]|nr:PIN domain-containing protein [Spirochaetaceae bacterium]